MLMLIRQQSSMVAFIDAFGIDENMLMNDVNLIHNYLTNQWSLFYNFIKPYKPTLNPLLSLLVKLVSTRYYTLNGSTMA